MHKDLSTILESIVSLDCVSINKMQKLHSSPSTQYIEKRIENTTRICDNEGDFMLGVLYLRRYIKK